MGTTLKSLGVVKFSKRVGRNKAHEYTINGELLRSLCKRNGVTD